MSVEALNCPNCGSAVESDRTQCQFCGSRLKTMACPACMGMMFEGSKFCQHCGKRAVETAVTDETKLGNCPRCKTPLDLLKIGETTLRECLRCDGMWADVATFEHLCATSEEQSAVLGFIGERNRTVEPLATVSYVPCPDCSQLMNRSNFAKASGVIIDICKQHGVWFDANELQRIIEFIQKGGMEHMRKRERMEIDAERERLRFEQRNSALQNRRLGGNLVNHGDEEKGIKGFLASLFDI
ncbi:MAG TPA: zf-TFIIB domain-containing protein [Pyrinomonadaceae bacterium]|nr:zf-TFIIB domain-containing protein [Pyrinomonadaceae bacterium]